MNRLTTIMKALGAFGAPKPVLERPYYPYPLGKPTSRSNGRSSHNLSHTKSGPGRRHRQGVQDHARTRSRKLRSCSR